MLLRSGQGRCRRPEVAASSPRAKIEGQGDRGDDRRGRRGIATASRSMQTFGFSIREAQRLGASEPVCRPQHALERGLEAVGVCPASAAPTSWSERRKADDPAAGCGRPDTIPAPADRSRRCRFAAGRPPQQREIAEPPGRQRDADEEGHEIEAGRRRARGQAAAVTAAMGRHQWLHPSAATMIGNGAR